MGIPRLRDLYADVVVRTGGVRTNLRRSRTMLQDYVALTKVKREVPWLADVVREIGPCRRQLRGRYEQYTNFVSNPGNALSLKSSAFLFALCRKLRPARVLDLGSGFTSYVTRTYQSESSSPVSIVSVDDSQEWLERTGDYLDRVGLSTEGLINLSDFEKSGLGAFDVTLYDLGSMETRLRWLPHALSCVQPDSGIAIIDDCHFGDFLAEAESQVRDLGGRTHDISRLTRDQFDRVSFLVTNIPR